VVRRGIKNEFTFKSLDLGDLTNENHEETSEFMETLK